MKRTLAVIALTLAVGLIASSAPGSGGRVTVVIRGGPKTPTSMDITGTVDPDRIRIGRRPHDGAYVIEANRPIRTRSGFCMATAQDARTVECDFPDQRFIGIDAILDYGADRLRMATSNYPNLLVSGNSGNDRLTGGDSHDILNGDRGDDRLSAHGEGDRLDGGNGDDRLDGGSGRDILQGGRGRDQCVGGPGKDRKGKC